MEKKEYYLLVVDEQYSESYHSLHATYEGALRDFYQQIGRVFLDIVLTKKEMDDEDFNDYIKGVMDFDKIRYESGGDEPYFYIDDTEIYIEKITLKED